MNLERFTIVVLRSTGSRSRWRKLGATTGSVNASSPVSAASIRWHIARAERGEPVDPTKLVELGKTLLVLDAYRPPSFEDDLDAFIRTLRAGDVVSGFDDLFDEAAGNAGQDSFADASWGAELKLAENERWAGRFRGEDVTSFNNEQRRVHLLEELDGTPLFIRGRAKLDRQFEKANPNVGDTVAIVRLGDVVLDSGNTMHDYGVAVKRGEGPPPAAKPAERDDIPF